MTEEVQLSNLFWELGRWSGMLGFTFLSLLIISGDTARYLDRYFGLDKIIKFQRKFSLFTAVFILFHPLFFILSTGLVAEYTIPDFTVLPFALGITSFYIFAAVMLASYFAKRISYMFWQYIHVLTYVLFFSVLYHALNWGSSSNEIIIKSLYLVLALAMIIGIIYRTQYKIRQLYSEKFLVKEIRQENRDAFTLVLSRGEDFKFRAGQFCFLRLNKSKLYARHPFTISSSPEDRNLHFTIKRAGRFTLTAGQLKPGEEVIVDGPFGNFVVPDDQQDLVFLAGGVGITPFISILKNQVNHNKKQNILLLYGTKTEEEIIFRNEIDNINEDWLKKIYVLSQSKSGTGPHENGYINKSLIQKYVKNIKEARYYICGPELMKDSCQKSLLGLGVARKNIIVEDFFW